MMTSLVLLVPIVVSVTVAASQILEDRLISRSKDTFTVSPEMEFDSIKMDSKRSSRRHLTKINEDAKETKTSQFLFADGISENQLSSTTPSTFKDIGISKLKNDDRRPITTIKTDHRNSDNNKSATNFSNIEKDRDKAPNDDRNKLERKALQISENDVNNLRMETNNLGNDFSRSLPSNFPGGQLSTRGTQKNEKGGSRNVKSAPRNVKSGQGNVKNGQGSTKSTRSNVESGQNIKATNNVSAESVKAKTNNVQDHARAAQNSGRSTQDNVKTIQSNVTTLQNNVKSTENNVRSVWNVKTGQTNIKNAEDNVRSAENVKVISNHLKTGQTNVINAEHSFRNAESVKTSNVKIKIGQNNVKSGENTKRNTNMDNFQKTDATSTDNDVSNSRTKDTKNINPSQTTTNLKSTLRPSSILENDPPGTDHHRYKLGKRNRKNKGFFFHYPYVPQIRHHYPHYDSNFEDCNYSGSEERTPGGKKKYQDSNIYYIKLPPTPYMFVPGLGYVSQPPRYSPPPQLPPLNPPMANVRPFRPPRPPTIYQPHVNPFIKVPIDFISNGKPTSVYQWQDEKPPSRNDNQITNLDKGPYVFNGRPSSIYLIRPDGSQTIPQPIRLNDYQNNGYYSSATFD